MLSLIVYVKLALAINMQPLATYVH